MAINFSVQTRKAAFTKTITLPATKALRVLIDGVEDTDYQLTAPSGGSATVQVTITASSNA